MTELPRRNPFANNVVAGPRERDLLDVPEIHAGAFAACLEAVEQTRLARASSSVMVYGEPGSGKTHLLARLRAHLERHALGDLAAMANVVAVRLNTSPRLLWRHLRQQVAEDLREEFDGKPCLHWVLGVRLHAEEPEPRKEDTRRYVARWLPWLQQPRKDEAGLRAFIEKCVKNRDLATVLLHLLSERHVHEAWAWLRGDSLPESVLDRLEVAPDPAEDEELLEARAREVVFSLCRLAGHVPFVFCFDQVEALHESAPHGAGLGAFGRMAAELHDGVPNAVLVSSVQMAYQDNVSRLVRAADLDRVRKREVALAGLTADQGAALVRSRIGTLPDLTEERRGQPDWWPLDPRDLEPYFAGGGCTARRFLAACAALYDRARGLEVALPPPPALPQAPTSPPPTGPAPARAPARRKRAAPVGAEAPAPPAPASPAGYLADTWQTRFESALTRETPDDADAVLQVGLPDALRLAMPASAPAAPTSAAALAPSPSPAPPPAERDVELLIPHPRGPVGLSLCNQRNLTSLAAKLRRLAQRRKSGALPVERLVLVRHPALPISPGAKKAWEYERELRAGGARWCHPSPEAFAALAALRDLLADARAGDLSCAGETVAPATVEDWVRAHLPAPLCDLADELIGDTPQAPDTDADAELRAALVEWLGERHLAPLEDAAAALGRPSAALAACARARPAQFGLLDGPPALLFRQVPETLPGAEE